MSYEEMKASPFGALLIEAYELALEKNKDYGRDDDIWANFRLSESMGVPNSTGVAVRLSDKWQRFTKGVRDGGKYAIRHETMKDTCIDIINYVSIFYALWEEENKINGKEKPEWTAP